MIFDNEVKRRRRPEKGGNQDENEFEGVNEKIPDTDAALDDIDAAIQKAFLKASRGGCGCSRCGPLRNCPNHPECDGGSGEDLRGR